MPVHDYTCWCGTKVDNVYSFVDQPEQPVLCPKCGAAMSRKPCAPNFKVQGGTPKFHQGSNK